MSTVTEQLEGISSSALDVLVRLLSNLGVFAFGVAAGMTLLGFRFPQCQSIGGEFLGQHCAALAWGSSTAQTAAIVGGVLLFAGMAAEYIRDLSDEAPSGPTE